MIENKITEKFYNDGLELKPKDIKDISKLDYLDIIRLFEVKGLIIFRDFEIDPQRLSELTSRYTETYANDAQRRENRLDQKVVNNVDDGNQEMALHSEASFSPNWPEIVWFFCNEAPTEGNGGATTFCDGIKLWDSLSTNTKNFFQLNPIKYELEIPIKNISKKKGSKKWPLNFQGSADGILDYEKSILKITQIRFAVIHSRIPGKICFSNHTLYKNTDPTIIKWGTIHDKDIPSEIIKEVEEKSKLITYDLKWKKGDLLMIDNKRFMHGRRSFKEKDKRDIVNIQTATASFGYGSTTRKNIS